MPNIIPEYQQRTGVSGAGLGPGPVRPASSGLGEGLTDLAGGIQSVVKANEVIKERDAATWSAKTLSDTQSVWMQQLEDRKLKADPGAPNFTPAVLKDFDASATEVAQGAPTRQSKQFMTERLYALREELQRNAMSFEAASRVQNNVNVAHQSIDAAGNELINNPTLFKQRLAERYALFDAMPLSAEQKQQLKERAQSEMAKYAVIGRINANPASMLVELKAGSPTSSARSDLADLQAPQGSAYTDATQWNKRADGSQKGNGWLGLLRRPDGGVSSEISIGVEINGKEQEIPLMVPTLTRSEVQTLLSKDPQKPGFFSQLPDSIKQKALAFARDRLSQNKSPFASSTESPFAQPTEVVGKSIDPAVQSLSPEARLEMEVRARQTLNAQYIDQEHQMALAKQALELQQKKTQNGFLSAMQNGQLTADKVLNSNLDPFGSGSKDEFLNMLRARDKAPKTDSTTFNELFARINLPDTAPGKITNANQLNSYLIDGRLDIQDLDKLRAEVEHKGTADGEAEAKLKSGIFEVAKSTLTKSNPLIGLQDPIGDESLQRFTSWFLSEYQRQRGAGKTPTELLSPDSPDYLGKRITNYVRNPQQIMQDVLKSATTPAVSAIPRKEGESAEDYLKRTGKL